VCSMLRSVRGVSRGGGAVQSYTPSAGRTSRQCEGVGIVRKLIDLFRGVLACSDGREQCLAVRPGSQQARSARSCGGHSCRGGNCARRDETWVRASRTGGCVECVMQIVESKRASRG
jgi:hypothetical protein